VASASDRPGANGAAAPGDGAIDLVALGIVLLRRRWTIIAFAAIAALLAGSYRLSKTRTYTSSATFAPQAPRRGGASNLAGLAAQFGVAVPTGEASQSPAFYADLVQSRGVLRAAVRTPYTFQTDSGVVRTTLTSLYGRKQRTAAAREDAAIRRLRGEVTAGVVQKTGVVSLGVVSESPELSRQIAQLLIDEVSKFNLESRRTQASAERQFTERRLADAAADLRRAEAAEVDFALRNRISDAPTLRLEAERLARATRLRQEVYTQLAQSYEQARIDEVRDTPVITVVEPPEAPLRPNPRGVVSATGVALVLGAFAGIVWALAREFAASSRATDRERFEELEALRADALRDLVRPWRPIARALRARGGA